MSTVGNLALAVDSLTPERETLASRVDVEITFEHGLFGFPDCRSFVMVPAPREGFYWLQSTEHEALCLLVADPFRLFRGYVVDLPKLDAAALGAGSPEDVAILVTVTLPEAAGRACTANLQGPIAINLQKRLGRQVILNKASWGVREPVYLTD